MAPTPWLSTINPLVAALRLTTKFSVGSDESVADDRDRDRPRLSLAGPDHDGADPAVVAAGYAARLPAVA